jgi:ACS family allantoate permease-like MFS transporter
MATATERTTPADVEKVSTTIGNTAPLSGLKKTIDEKLLKHSHDADAAMKAFEGMDGQVIELTEAKNKALLRKIDMHLMPVRCFPNVPLS